MFDNAVIGPASSLRRGMPPPLVLVLPSNGELVAHGRSWPVLAVAALLLPGKGDGALEWACRVFGCRHDGTASSQSGFMHRGG